VIGGERTSSSGGALVEGGEKGNDFHHLGEGLERAKGLTFFAGGALKGGSVMKGMKTDTPRKDF